MGENELWRIPTCVTLGEVLSLSLTPLPPTVPSWSQILLTYKSWQLNFQRFCEPVVKYSHY
jgi:hypothetical protein